MPRKEEIESAFGQIGHRALSADLVSKLAQLCASQNRQPKELAEAWEAFALTRGTSELTDASFAAYESSLLSHHKRGAGTIDTPTNKRQAVVITPPRSSYQDRSGAGALLAAFHTHLTAEFPRKRGRCVIAHCSMEHFRHMFATVDQRAQALEQRWIHMNHAICHSNDIIHTDRRTDSETDPLPIWSPLGMPCQHAVVCVGRITNEAQEGRLNRSSVQLEGSRQHSAGIRIPLDLSDHHTAYSLFPGQIVAMEGINSSGRLFRPTRVYDSAPPPIPMHKATNMMHYQYSTECQNGSPLSILVMSGPYTTNDNLDYAPLLDAVLKIQEERPDVVIMCGPFVDARHPSIQQGEPTLTDDEGNVQTVTFECLFFEKISMLFVEMYENDPEMPTQIVFVPSVEDAFCDSVFPQPPFIEEKHKFGTLGLHLMEMAGRETIKSPPKRVHCVSNPCTLTINEISIGVTSSDILFHINSEEINANLPPVGRLPRLAQHLIQQRSYYPLFPAPMGTYLDLSRSHDWEMPVQPDILILPSKLNPFVKDILENTVVLNPGELTKNTTGGTYATIEVHPLNRQMLEESALLEKELKASVPERVKVEIKRI